MDESGPAQLATAQHDAALQALRDGRLDDARVLAATAVDTATAAFGPDSADLANIVLTLADVEEAAGNFSAALTLAERAAATAAPLADSDDDELVALWVDIEVACARIRCTQGGYGQAEARLAAALTTATRVLAPDDPGVLSIHNMRGVTAKYAGRFDDAEAHYERVRAVLDIEPTADPQALAVLLHNLGGLAHSRGRVVEGLAHARRGLTLRIGTVGDNHPDVASDLNAIGALHHDAGDAPAAEGCYRRALEIFENTLGAEHYEVGMTCANLAVAVAASGDTQRAQQYYEQALQILQRPLGATHPDVALVRHNLAVLLADAGDLEAAHRQLADAEKALTAALTPQHPRLLELQATIKDLSPQRNPR